MQDANPPELAKWPFFLADALLLGVAYYLYYQGPLPLGMAQLGLGAGSIAAGAVLSVIPFILEYRAAVKLAETAELTSVVAQIQKLETLAAQVSGATAHWQVAQEQAEKVAGAARQIADQMSSEAKSFQAFMQRANDTEKGTLKLEVDKLRRGEGEWIQTTVRILDHVYALHVGALRSGQPNLIEQVGSFQRACREVTRRIGLLPYVAESAEVFDPEKHQLVEPNAKAPEGAVVSETIATGYTYQGRLLRPALVKVVTKDPPPA